jgi:hypothetical protein
LQFSWIVESMGWIATNDITQGACHVGENGEKGRFDGVCGDSGGWKMWRFGVPCGTFWGELFAQGVILREQSLHPAGITRTGQPAAFTR